MTVRIETIKTFCRQAKHYSVKHNIDIDRLYQELYEVVGEPTNVKAFLTDASRYVLGVTVIKK